MPDARAARSPRMTSCPETRPNRRWAALIWGPHSALPGANTPPFSFPPPPHLRTPNTHPHAHWNTAVALPHRAFPACGAEARADASRQPLAAAWPQRDDTQPRRLRGRTCFCNCCNVRVCAGGGVGGFWGCVLVSVVMPAWCEGPLHRCTYPPPPRIIHAAAVSDNLRSGLPAPTLPLLCAASTVSRARTSWCLGKLGQ